MQLETTVIRRELDDQPAIEGVDERLEELAEIRVLLGLRALVGDYLDETFKVRGKDGMLALPVLEGLEARLETHRDRVDELAMAS